jgi:hypothetical protein
MSITLSSAQVVLSGAALASGAATATAVFCATAGRRLRADVRREDLPELDLTPPVVPVPAAQIPDPEPEPEAAVPAAPDPVEDPGVELDPLSPASAPGLWQGRLLADDLPEPALVWWPEHAWHRNPTVPLRQLPHAACTAAPREIAVTTVVAGQVFTDRCEVKV